MQLAEALIQRLEDASNKRMRAKHEKMTEITEQIHQELKAVTEEEKQLNQFSEALIKLSNEIKSTEES